MPIRLADPVQDLIDALEKLPGLGPISAQRAAFFLLRHRTPELENLEKALSKARTEIRRCPLCHTFTDQELCNTCSDQNRDRSLLCIVESVADQMALDASLAWPGLYFVLSGRLSPVQGIGPGDIGMPVLLKRIEEGNGGSPLREVVIATSYTPEGDATAYYIIDILKKRWPDLHVTRLARGLPTGIEIEYTDLNTIANAVYSRR